ncbi:hypothetical protein EYF80_019577 [Liparis tanakae]|uniref:Uncharacterized protein n=1 Tax=Liparis tanakae TaxID=230148 RepID=A0A4Z2HWH8_9TELE|nr:hypothetical protein EYF80_019577 [Liparis tanakae]
MRRGGRGGEGSYQMNVELVGKASAHIHLTVSNGAAGVFSPPRELSYGPGCSGPMACCVDLVPYAQRVVRVVGAAAMTGTAMANTEPDPPRRWHAGLRLDCSTQLPLNLGLHGPVVRHG